MLDNTQIDRIFKKLRKIYPIITGTAIGLFLSGNIVPIPPNFPYSHGIWGVMGVCIIILISFIFSYLSYVIKKKIGLLQKKDGEA
ncbi:VIT1/CCC1 family predicted Fe2+/Mn2+ transporter [Parabacteroides faecis]|jgi:hypothetical protein|uniref:VIT1/CCC1 family predicted Fe2+/Mn2+ transporter n=1 Tax=Parabacteroides faecis TaxID=1217282 RepID=A0ABR6KQN2_9BACT|nr:VIT1/CCC1 family predicted Fe2+/Mn2+ transporter [Parabacteroides faecis]RHR96553.1 hypothetical protein DWW23_14670 [Parabacteroides sp. AF14-59]